MKKIITCMLAMPIVFIASAQSKSFDSVAVVIIDRMTDVIGDLESCSFKLDVSNDVNDPVNGLVKDFANYEIYMSGPNKMKMNSYSIHGHREFAYNGKQLAYYSFKEHNFGIIPAPSTTIKTIDSINANYGIEFPAADFFYPAFTDDLMENSDSVKYLGLVTINGKEYFDIMAFGKEMNFQFWVSNDAYNLPAKFAITYKKQEGNPQYLAEFSDWQINPNLPSAMFDFLPPPGAAPVRILSKNEK